MDRYFCAQPDLAQMVVECLYKGVALGHYELGAFVVMVNHVHVLLLPRIPPSRLLQSLKGFTARDEAEYGRIAAYIENNPVSAGLAERAEDYRWSSASPKRLDTIVETADTSVRATIQPNSLK